MSVNKYWDAFVLSQHQRTAQIDDLLDRLIATNWKLLDTQTSDDHTEWLKTKYSTVYIPFLKDHKSDDCLCFVFDDEKSPRIILIDVAESEGVEVGERWDDVDDWINTFIVND